MGKLVKAEFVELLVGLDSSHDSIVSSSSKFLNLEPDYFDAATQIYFENFRSAIEQSILKNKVQVELLQVRSSTTSTWRTTFCKRRRARRTHGY
jgi:hypothetical protein